MFRRPHGEPGLQRTYVAVATTSLLLPRSLLALFHMTMILCFDKPLLASCFQITTRTRGTHLHANNNNNNNNALPPEAEEFFESLDQWARNSQARNTRPALQQRNDLLESDNDWWPTTRSDDNDDNDTNDTNDTNDILNRPVHNKVLLELELDLDLDADVDDDAPFLDTETYLELSRQTMLEATSISMSPSSGDNDYNDNDNDDDDEWNAYMSAPAVIPMTDPSFRDGLSNFIERETVPSGDTTQEATVISDDDAVENLLQSLRRHGRHAANHYNASVGEQLDRQVFDNETGHTRSSDLFRRALTDESARAEALTERRTRLYRQRQADGLARLDALMRQFMEETVFDDGNDNDDDDDDDGDDVGRFFDYEKDDDDDDGVYENGEYDKTDDFGSEIGREQLLRSNTNNNNGLAVDGNGEEQQQQRVMPPQSTATTKTTTTTTTPPPPPPRQQSDSRQTDPWFSMVDPETQEVFYWNQETEEMRWEAPAWDHRNSDPDDRHLNGQ